MDEWHGTTPSSAAATRYRTYFVNNRGDEVMGNTWSDLDITALGRQKEREGSPEGWNRHDEYQGAKRPQGWSDQVDRGVAAFSKGDT